MKKFVEFAQAIIVAVLFGVAVFLIAVGIESGAIKTTMASFIAIGAGILSFGLMQMLMKRWALGNDEVMRALGSMSIVVLAAIPFWT